MALNESAKIDQESPVGKAEICFYAGILLAALVSRYSGANHGVFFSFLVHLAHPGLITELLGLDLGVVRNSSIFYVIVDILDIDLHRDIFGFSIYMALSIIGCAFLFLFVGRLTGAGMRAVFFIVMMSVFLNEKFNFISHPAIFYPWNGSPSVVGHVLMFPVIYFAFTRRHLAAALTLTLAILSGMKVIWLPAVAVVIFAVLDPKTRWHAVAVYLIPFVSALTLAFGNPAPRLSAEALDAIAASEGGENALFRQPPIALGLFFVLMVAAPILFLRQASPEVRLFCGTVYAVTLLSTIFGAFYFEVGRGIVPSSTLMMMGYIRANKLLIIVFSIVLLAELYRTDRFQGYEKLALALAFLVLKTNLPSVLMATGLVTAGVIVPRLITHVTARPPAAWPVVGPLARMSHSIHLSVMTGAVVAVIVALQTVKTSPWIHYNTHAAATAGKWFIQGPLDPAAWDAALKLREDKKDYPLIALQRVGDEFHFVPPIYVAARKSSYVSSYLHTMWDKDLVETHFDRVRRQNRFVEDMRDGSLDDPEGLERVIRDGARVLVPAGVKGQFPQHLIRRDLDDFVLLGAK